MENNLPMMAKRLWNLVRVLFFMVRKGIYKSKLSINLNVMMKRGKIAGKAFGNHMFHHHHHCFAAPREYEFNCSNTPSHYNFLPFHASSKRNKHHHSSHLFSRTHEPSSDGNEEFYNSNNNNGSAVELMYSNNTVVYEAVSPILPRLGFGKSSMVRQLRVTDLPLPLQNEGQKDNHIDEATEEFIQRFCKQLKQQFNF
ncbi:hypothetical protein Ancab_010984 [Ancistrocladus abbreviatus]